MTLEEWLGPVRAKTAMAAETPIVSQRTPTAGPLVQPAILYSNQRDALLAQDAHTASLFATGGRPVGLPPYRETPLAGCATVLDLARRDTGFDPTRVSFGLNADGILARLAEQVLGGRMPSVDISIGQPDILAYFQRLSQCPLFTVVASEQRGSFAARDLSQLPSIMLSTAMPETRAEPLARLQRLGGSFNENVTVNPFYFSAVREQNADIYVDIFFAALWLRRERPRFPWIIVAFELPMGLYFITHLSLRFNTPAWAASAAAVSDRHYQSVADWLASN